MSDFKPYYAAIFTSTLKDKEDISYHKMAERMVELAKEQRGFKGIEAARDEIGITVSYWEDLASIKAWKANAEHQIAQELGIKRWYSKYHLRIAKIEREYQFSTDE